MRGIIPTLYQCRVQSTSAVFKALCVVQVTSAVFKALCVVKGTSAVFKALYFYWTLVLGHRA